jgi:hypothetical protein
LGKHTTQMGIGMAKSSNSRAVIYVVANYYTRADLSLKIMSYLQKDREKRISNIK